MQKLFLPDCEPTESRAMNTQIRGQPLFLSGRAGAGGEFVPGNTERASAASAARPNLADPRDAESRRIAPLDAPPGFGSLCARTRMDGNGKGWARQDSNLRPHGCESCGGVRWDPFRSALRHNSTTVLRQRTPFSTPGCPTECPTPSGLTRHNQDGGDRSIGPTVYSRRSNF